MVLKESLWAQACPGTFWQSQNVYMILDVSSSHSVGQEVV